MLSIIIPAYNCKNFIEQTIKQLFNFPFPDLEVIVRDDCSTDGTYELLLGLQEKYLFILNRNEINLDKSITTNRLYNECNGDYFLKLDADDILFIEKVKQGYDYLIEKKEIDALAFRYAILEIDGEVKLLPIHDYIQPGIQENLVRTVFLENPFHLCFIIFKKETLEKSKKEDSLFMNTEIGDLEIILSLAENGLRLHYIKEVAGQYRMHQNNSSKQPLKQAKSWINDVFPAHRSYLKKYLYKDTKKVLLNRVVNYLKNCVYHRQKIDFDYLKVSLFTYLKF